MRRRGVATLAACRHRSGSYAIAKLDNGDETVSAGAVHLHGTGIRARAKRCKRTPSGRCESDRAAWTVVVKGLNDIAGETLEAVYLAPGGSPISKVALECSRCCGQCLEVMGRARWTGNIVRARHAGITGIVPDTSHHLGAPVDGQRSRDGVDSPTEIPVAQDADLLGHLCSERARCRSPVISSE